MDQGGVAVVGHQLGGGVHPAPVGDDGVALRVAGAGHVPHNPGAVGLVGIPPGHGPAHQVDGGAFALHYHLKVGVGLLLPLGEQPLPDDQLGPLAQGGLGLPGGAVHPADLGGVHLQDGVLLQVALGDGVDGADARAAAGAHVLFHVLHPGALLQKEPVDAVVPGGLPVFRVDAAARHNGDVGVLAHVKVVVHQVVHVPVGDAGGDGHGLSLGAGEDADVKAGQVLLCLDLDVLRGLAAGAAPVLPDVEGPGEIAVPVGDEL